MTTGHFSEGLPSQTLDMVLNKLNPSYPTQQKQSKQECNDLG